LRSTLITVILAILVVSGYYFGKKLYLKPRIERGVRAAEINSILPNGEPFMLSSLRGHYVLLDFWGSWCRPCREEHPELVKIYNEFHEANFKNADGFEIVSFGVERNKQSWQNAILSDGLTWKYHLVSENLFDSPGIEAFKVRQIPTRFLINPKGVIIAVDPALGEVRKVLKSHTTAVKPK
jgi:thiol-disulfide isomerase/thioredoxin